MRSNKGLSFQAGLILVALFLTGCGSEVPTLPAPMMSIPSLNEEDILPLATERCENAFILPVSGGTPVGLPLYLRIVEYDSLPKWGFADYPHQPNQEEDLGFLVCIVQSRVKDGSYSDGAIGYRRDWSVRIVDWLDGTVLSENVFQGTASPGAKTFDGDAYGDAPYDDFMTWLAASQPGDLEFVYAGVDVDNLAYIPNSPNLAYASYQGLAIVDLEGNQAPGSLEGAQSPVAVSTDGELLASGEQNNLILLWDAKTQSMLTSLYAHMTKEVFSLTFSMDGRILASAGGDGRVRLWDASNGQPLHELVADAPNIVDLAFSPDGQTIAAATQRNVVPIWDAQTGEQLAGLEKIGYGANSLAYSPDGEWIAIGGSNSSLSIWNADTGEEVLRLSRAEAGSRYGNVTFSPDGTLFAASFFHWVRIWETTTWNELPPLVGHTKDVTSITFSPDSRTIVTGSNDQTIRFWTVEP